MSLPRMIGGMAATRAVDAGEGIGRVSVADRSLGRRGGCPRMIFFWLGRSFLQGCGGAFFYGVEQVADPALIRWNHALEDGAAGAGAAGNQHLLKDRGSGRDHMRLFGKALQQRRPILDAVVGYAQEAYVRSGSDEALLQVLAKAVVDGQRDDERSHARGYSDDRNAGDDADERLAALGAQVAGRDEEFKAHAEHSAVSSELSAKSDYSCRLFDRMGPQK